MRSHMLLLTSSVMRFGLCLTLIGMVFSQLSAAHAHPRREAETEITFNEASGRTEIIHRFRVHDSEEAMQALYDPSLSILTDPQAQALFGSYAEDRFSIRHNGQLIPLDFVGGEIEDGFIWLYQVAPRLPEDGIYVVRSNALIDFHPDQTNIVNIRMYDQTHSLVFTRTTPWATLRLTDEASEAATP